MFTWARLQDEVGRWVKKNFPESPPKHQIWGLIEELGELTHSHLKREQGIRGSEEKHIAAGKDSVADSVIFFMNVCTMHNWGAQEVLRSATPEEFQSTFSVPPGRTPLTHALKYLSALNEILEVASNASRGEWFASMSGAKGAAHSYLSGLAAYCTQMGWSLQDIIEDVWPKVRARDWTKNKTTGGDLDAPKEDFSHGQAQKDLDAEEDAELLKHLDAAKVRGIVEEVEITVANLEPIKKMELHVAEKVNDAFVEALDEKGKKKRNG